MLEGIREMLPEDEKEVRLFILTVTDGSYPIFIKTEEYLSKFTASRDRSKSFDKKTQTEPVRAYICGKYPV